MAISKTTARNAERRRSEMIRRTMKGKQTGRLAKSVLIRSVGANGLSTVKANIRLSTRINVTGQQYHDISNTSSVRFMNVSMMFICVSNDTAHLRFCRSRQKRKVKPVVGQNLRYYFGHANCYKISDHQFEIAEFYPSIGF